MFLKVIVAFILVLAVQSCVSPNCRSQPISAKELCAVDESRPLTDSIEVHKFAFFLERNGQFESAADCYTEIFEAISNESMKLNLLESISENYAAAGLCNSAARNLEIYEDLFAKLWYAQSGNQEQPKNPQLDGMKASLESCWQASSSNGTYKSFKAAGAPDGAP